MRPRHDRRPGEAVGGVVCLAVAPWCPCAGRDAVWGDQRARAADDWPPRGGGQGLWQAGGRGGDAAQTP
jgi:hypothetical protein